MVRTKTHAFQIVLSMLKYLPYSDCNRRRFLMNKADKDKDFVSESQIKISDDVVATISGLAASEVDGVDSMAGNITNEIVGKLGIKNSSKGVRIAIDGDEVTAELYINIKYGFRITDVTSQIQDKVKTAIENMTGLKVVAVNIHVVEIIV